MPIRVKIVVFAVAVFLGRRMERPERARRSRRSQVGLFSSREGQDMPQKVKKSERNGKRP